jgi:hypothetical protein
MLKRVIEQEPRHAGAWLDLALIQCAWATRRGRTPVRHHRERFAPPRGIQELIATEPRGGCQRLAAGQQWR